MGKTEDCLRTANQNFGSIFAPPPPAPQLSELKLSVTPRRTCYFLK